MAKPDTDDGWFKKAVELETAVNYAGFSRVARVLLGYVFIQIFGRGKRPELAFLPRKETASRLRQKRQNFDRAIQELVESGVLIEVRDDQYRFVKDYEKWIAWSRDSAKRGWPRLSPEDIEDCKDMPVYAESFRIRGSTDPQSPEGIQMDAKSASNGMQNCIQMDAESASNGMQNCIQMDAESASNGMQNCIQMDASPIEVRARGIRELEIKREGERGSPPPDSASPSKAEDLRSQGQSELDGIAARCRAWFPSDPEIARAVAEGHGSYPAASYLAAAETLRTRPPGKHGRGYFMSLVAGVPSPEIARPVAAPRYETFRPTPEQLAARVRRKPERNGAL